MENFKWNKNFRISDLIFNNYLIIWLKEQCQKSSDQKKILAS